MKKSTKIVISICALFIVAGFVVMFGTNLFAKKSSYETMPEANAISAEITRNSVIEQSFESDLDNIDEVAIVFTRICDYEEDEEEKEIPEITIRLLCDDEIVAEKDYDVDEIEDQHRTFLQVNSSKTGLKNKVLTLRIENNSYLDSGLALMIQDNEIKTFKFNQMNVEGTICFCISGK